MIEGIDSSLIDWSRAQFALTAIYHWLFVPLTLGLGIIQAIFETKYVITNDDFWKRTAKFWMKIFGINFAIGVATGLILEFQFGTNWSNYSWFVGDIFGAPLAIEGIFAFFMEAIFIAIMYFGWEKVGKKFHLAATWLTIFGATVSAYWILVANSWMQYPSGMNFNPDTVRNEMNDFWAVALSPVAINKFFHSVLSGWIVGSAFVVGISSWFFLKKRESRFAMESIKVAAIFGFAASVLIALTGDKSAYLVSEKQPMKLAAMEGLYEGGKGEGLVAVGFINPKFNGFEVSGEQVNDEKPILMEIKFPKMLSLLATREFDGFVPGVKELLEGGYPIENEGDDDEILALSATEKIERGKIAINALAEYRAAKEAQNPEMMEMNKEVLDENFQYFGYGYLDKPEDLIPPVGLTFYSFRIMVVLGVYFIVFFIAYFILSRKKLLSKYKILQWIGIITIPLAYIASQTGWIVAEVGRQPWAIQDILPVNAGISRLATSSVQTTFIIFAVLFSILLIAELSIMIRAIKKGPEDIVK
jgi:cytochrome bd ubiquinol oxidase subunit I